MDLFEKLKTNPVIPPFLSKRGIFVVDEPVGISLLVATAYKKKKDNYLIIASSLYKAQEIFNLLASFLNTEDVLLFPADELVRAETIAQSKEMVAQRLYVVDQISNDKKKIIIANISAATRYLPSLELFKQSTLHFEVGKSYSLSDIREKLSRSGYFRVNKIDSSLQFAIRGDILDIFSVNMDNPVRIEFFGDEVESIRVFDLSEQTSIKSLDEVTILPGSDILLSEDEINNAETKINGVLQKNKAVLPGNIYDSLVANVDDVLEKIKNGQLDQSTYKYFSLVSNNTHSIFDYCKDYTKVMVSESSIENSNKLLQDESWQYLNELFEDGKCINQLSMYQDINRLINKTAPNTIWTKELKEAESDVVFEAKQVPFVASRQEDLFTIIHTYLNDEYKIIAALDSKSHILTFEEALTNANLTYETLNSLSIPNRRKIGVTLYSLPRGFVLPEEKIVVLTANELFNIKIRNIHYNNKFKEATLLKSYEDLQPGDYVVHEYQGIGQFMALETIEIDGNHQDFLKILYRGDELLYVPLSQFQLVRKYTSKEGYSPRLSRLHSKDWENTKKKIKQKVNDLATRLMNLYIERSKVKGFAFDKDDEYQLQFENAFPYQLTKDQEISLQDIKKDMESDTPMDRLLCGDVGFGKTEIAFRAAFKAIISGKQVAFLCPTTLLARQHYELAVSRFTPFGVNVGMLSRLVSKSDEKDVIDGLATGRINLVIGTHKLLSSNVVFKDLGLLIIDEEQRFGVEQKEKIKELKTNIDVLTLSATPIPRTLQASLVGIRSLSQINTPPRDRMPIQTYVTPYKPEIVKELIERELGRQGQVFFLHNQVSDIYFFASRLQKLVPSATIGVIHGQMNRDDIEDVMIKFYDGQIDVLVCTSIIENGIDVPNANMIIVQDSERYGLSQLYQIKGRVGRSNKIAYAYLMYPESKKLAEPARKRLKALQEFTELGSGYKVAQRDLMIRGAGDILGPEQAGFIDSVGFDMYIRLLNEAVQDKLNGVPEKEEEIVLNNNLSVDAYIPSSYASQSDKIELYQEISVAETIEQLLITKQKTIDIYGKLPKETELLFKKKEVDILTRTADIKNFTETKASIELVLGEEYCRIKSIGNILFETLIPFMSYTKINYRNREFYISMSKRDEWINDLIDLLNSL